MNIILFVLAGYLTLVYLVSDARTINRIGKPPRPPKPNQNIGTALVVGIVLQAAIVTILILAAMELAK